MRPTLIALSLIALLLAACQQGTPPQDSTVPNVLAVETFLADIAQNVAGERLMVQSLMPAGLDPHAYEPTPKDLAKIAESQVLILNGAGLEASLERILESAGGERLIIEASAGLESRDTHETLPGGAHGHEDGDPHFWLDPNNVVQYVENIRHGLSQADPAGADVYNANAEAYIAKLKALDAWIVEQVAQIPAERRLLVTNHESLGYFADRYGFEIAGTILPSFSTGASPSAQELAQLVERIKATGAPAIFLETGANPQLARQIADEAGIQVVTELYSHSITPPDGEAPTYIDIMKFNVGRIVTALR
jgi:ABC-type Zn uptake system ZnuABC Zn-binding protein ZnuA